MATLGRKLQKDYTRREVVRGLTPLWKQQLAGLTDKGKQVVDDWWLQNKDKYMKIIEKPGVIPSILSALCLSVVLNLTDQWQVVVDGKVLGVVKDPEAVVCFVQELDEFNRENYNSALLLNDLKLARSYGKPAGDAEDLQVILQNELTWGVQGAVIKVNNQEIVALRDRDCAQTVLENLKQKVVDQLSRLYSSVTIIDIDIQEDVQVVEKAVAINNLVDEATAETLLLSGKTERSRHVVSRGETFSSIAASRGLRSSDLRAANPDVEPTRLQIGQTINLEITEPHVNVTATAEVTETRSIPYETRYINDSNLYKGQTQTVTKGQAGTEEITSIVTIVNGKVVDSQVKSSKRLKEPVTAVVKKGTKQVVVTGSGQFVWPVNGTITSRFGPRWGKFHYGLDIAAASGTPIVAADSGVVKFAGWRGSYGYLVEIDHGNGYVTRYGHCSKLLVATGAKVSRGQTIARVGRTGFATGNHVHFEVIYKGVNKNPLNYLR
ncbi:MAG: M23 family metallopeptidase [Firmicutes bacterium]|nr:M23 family metallopeptidase [Bacillota bacterium]